MVVSAVAVVMIVVGTTVGLGVVVVADAGALVVGAADVVGAAEGVPAELHPAMRMAAPLTATTEETKRFVEKENDPMVPILLGTGRAALGRRSFHR